MSKQSVSLPPGSAGIFRFYNTESGGIKLKPGIVIPITAIFIIGILILRYLTTNKI
ncbi:MAG: preprotein translocase subunit Sec61beta [Candidatus Micrarchaeota archaeon]|nr:preprotein translocase subunit Sec61beta [Candidatus Micrarchaeota archaeon]